MLAAQDRSHFHAWITRYMRPDQIGRISVIDTSCLSSPLGLRRIVRRRRCWRRPLGSSEKRLSSRLLSRRLLSLRRRRSVLVQLDPVFRLLLLPRLPFSRATVPASRHRLRKQGAETLEAKAATRVLAVG